MSAPLDGLNHFERDVLLQLVCEEYPIDAVMIAQAKWAVSIRELRAAFVKMKAAEERWKNAILRTTDWRSNAGSKICNLFEKSEIAYSFYFDKERAAFEELTKAREEVFKKASD